MHLREIIIASLHPQANAREILHALKLRMKEHPQEINQNGLHGFTPCHLAVLTNQTILLEALVLEGNADLDIKDQEQKKPEQLTNDTVLVQKISKLKQEVEKRSLEKSKTIIRRESLVFPASNEKRLSGRELIKETEVKPESLKLPLGLTKFPPQIRDVQSFNAYHQNDMLQLFQLMNSLSQLTIEDKKQDSTPKLPNSQIENVLNHFGLNKIVHRGEGQLLFQFLLEGFDPNVILPNSGKPLLLYIFELGQELPICSLLKKGASLRCTDSLGKGIIDSILTSETTSKIKLLVRVQNRILDKLNTDALEEKNIDYVEEFKKLKKILKNSKKNAQIHSRN